MPETRTVKGFSEDGLPSAEGDFECCTFDHSDNSPYMLTRFHEVNAIFNFIRIPVRTGGCFKSEVMPENRSVKGFSAFSFLKYLKVFESGPL